MIGAVRDVIAEARPVNAAEIVHADLIANAANVGPVVRHNTAAKKGATVPVATELAEVLVRVINANNANAVNRHRRCLRSLSLCSQTIKVLNRSPARFE
jgi:hypothetical protein